MSIQRIAMFSAFAVIFAVAVAASVLMLRPEQTQASDPPAETDVQAERETDVRSEHVETEQLDKMAEALSPKNVRNGEGIKPAKAPFRKVVRSSRFQKIISSGEVGKPVARKAGEIKYGRSRN